MLVVAPLIGGELSALIRDLPLYARWLQETTGPFMLETLGVDPFDIRMDDIGIASGTTGRKPAEWLAPSSGT